MPPARRERARRSARLKSNNPLHSRAMDYEASQGLPKPPETSTPRLTIQWQSDRSLTDTLVNYLTTHSADCRILFYSDGKRAMATANDNPSTHQARTKARSTRISPSSYLQATLSMALHTPSIPKNSAMQLATALDRMSHFFWVQLIKLLKFLQSQGQI
jgi:hypothetical protein